MIAEQCGGDLLDEVDEMVLLGTPDLLHHLLRAVV